MAVITCTNCGKKISSMLTACPHCGAPVFAAQVPGQQGFPQQQYQQDQLGLTTKPVQPGQYAQQGFPQQQYQQDQVGLTTMPGQPGQYAQQGFPQQQYQQDQAGLTTMPGQPGQYAQQGFPQQQYQQDQAGLTTMPGQPGQQYQQPDQQYQQPGQQYQQPDQQYQQPDQQYQQPDQQYQQSYPQQYDNAQAAPKKKTGLIIGICAGAAILIAGIVVCFLLFFGNKSDSGKNNNGSGPDEKASSTTTTAGTEYKADTTVGNVTTAYDPGKTSTATTPAETAAPNTTAATTTPAETTTTPTTTTQAYHEDFSRSVYVYGDLKEDSLVIWMWNNDVKGIIDNVLPYYDKDLCDRIVYVNADGLDNYQYILDKILSDPGNELYPDIIALDSDCILKYTNGSHLLNISDIGITTADYSNQYQYTVDIATNNKGELKALSWQACPGSWTIRASLARKYLGTSDPKKVQQFFKNWDTVYETAKLVKEKSGGKTLLLPGYDDLKRVFLGSRKYGWHDTSYNLIIDQAMLDYMDFAQKLDSEGLTWGTSQWTDQWQDMKTGDYTLALPGCTWYNYWCLPAENFGDYILIDGPQPYAWGGTWLAATQGCSDKDTAAKFIKYMTCDSAFMADINAYNSDFVNNSVSNKERKDVVALNDGKPILSDAQGETLIGYYSKKVDKINGNLITAEDATINTLFDSCVRNYVNGSISKDEAIAAFKKEVADYYPYINAR